jgi:hypothetical protein
MSRTLRAIAMGLGGLVVALVLTAGAFAIAGQRIAQPAGIPIFITTTPSSSPNHNGDPSPMDDQTQSPAQLDDDHGGGSGGSTSGGSSGSDDAGGSEGHEGSGSEHSGGGSGGSDDSGGSGSVSDNSGTGSDDSGGSGSGSGEHGDD